MTKSAILLAGLGVVAGIGLAIGGSALARAAASVPHVGASYYGIRGAR